jgi:hypothetical protein
VRASILTCALLAVGCGGAPFTTGFDLAPVDDGGPDAVTVAAPDALPLDSPSAVPDAGPDAITFHEAEAEAGPGPDAAPDAGAREAEAPDAPPTCTPIPPSSYHCQAVTIDSPTAFAYMMFNPVGTDGGGYRGCSAAETPIACQCEETFGCNCLLAHVDAPTLCQKPGAVATCSFVNGAPEVSCP